LESLRTDETRSSWESWIIDETSRAEPKVIQQWGFIQDSSSPSWPCSPTLSWIAFLGKMGSTSLDAFAHGKVAKFFTFSILS